MKAAHRSDANFVWNPLELNSRCSSDFGCDNSRTRAASCKLVLTCWYRVTVLALRNALAQILQKKNDVVIERKRVATELS